MHRPGILYYPFRAHTLVHHQVFKYDESYFLKRPEDKWLITMAWWNYPLMLLIHLPFFGLFELAGLRITLGASLSMTLYYFTYEYLHFCYHAPQNRFFEKWRVYKFVNQHHRIHHKFMNKNMNVVFPLADSTLRTFHKTMSSETPKQPQPMEPLARV